MFNKSDFDRSACDALGRATLKIPQDPPDYFQGVPDAPLLLPQNILLFHRRWPFHPKSGTAHHRFVLMMSLRGAGGVIVDDRVVQLTPGFALLVTPHQFHHFTPFTDRRLLWLFVTFELPDVEALADCRGRALPLKPFPCACLERMARRYATLGRAHAPCPEITLLLALLLNDWHNQPRAGVRTAERPHAQSPSERLMQRVARYAHQHLDEAPDIATIARVVGSSASHLRAEFRRVAGISLGQYLRKLRLHRARTLALASSAPLKDIAAQCGYDSLYSFSRAFRQATGICARDYRKQTTRCRSTTRASGNA